MHSSPCLSCFIHSPPKHSSSPPHLLSTTSQPSLPNPHLTPTHKPNKSGTDSRTNGRYININDGKQQEPASAVSRLLVGPQGPPLVAPRGQKWHSSFACDTQRKSQTNETDEIDETDETDERDCEMGDSRGQPRCKGRGWVGGCRELRSGAAGPGGRGTQSGEAVERAGEREAGAGGGVAADTLKLS
jgi:hypothetical protein